MFLVYINKIGKDWESNNCYEFIFTTKLGTIDGEDWDITPASNLPKPPPKELVDSVYKLNTKIDLSLVTESDTFSYFDAIEGIVAIAWQNIMIIDDIPENRLFFKFGDTFIDVKNKLDAINQILEKQSLN